MAKYIVLRDANADLLPRATLAARARAWSGAPTGGASGSRQDVLPEPEISTEDISVSEMRELIRDPCICAIARAMPTRLIEPEPLDEARPEDAVAGWGCAAVGADRSPMSGAGVRVALLDTGIDARHDAFRGVTIERADFAGSGDHDDHGHGTHIAGTILGRDVDGTRIGIAPGITEAMIGKVLADDARGSSEMLFRGLCWAIEGRAQVISMALSFDCHDVAELLMQSEGFPLTLATAVAQETFWANLRLFDILIQLLRSKAQAYGGFLLIAAAGNDSRRMVSPEFEVGPSMPAAAAGVISVAALAQTDAGLAAAPFSNVNPTLSAPGVGIVSAASGGGLRALNGTSMACAHVAGIAALWAEAQALAGAPVSGGAITEQLRTHSTPASFAPGIGRTERGLGLVQAPMFCPG